MKKMLLASFAALTLPVTSVTVFAAHHGEASKAICEGFGPQTPRDIDNLSGSNNVIFGMAPPAEDMKLCNVHFHKNAEHKAKDFSIYAGDGKKGYNSGYQCQMSQSLSKKELKPTQGKICEGKYGDLKPGDTIEVHWVHTSCDVKGGPTLGACLSDACANPSLRVETQVFTLVNDDSALDFRDLKEAKDLPKNTGKPVEFLGSTTGPSFTEQVCSPLQVTWSVRPQCAKVDIKTVGKWCEGNPYNEDHAHGVRKLVTNPKLLSEIK